MSSLGNGTIDQNGGGGTAMLLRLHARDESNSFDCCDRINHSNCIMQKICSFKLSITSRYVHPILEYNAEE
jgi:hypothetical protein